MTSIAPFSSILDRIMQTSPEKVQQNQAANIQQTKSLEAAVEEATALFSATKLDDEDLAVLSYRPCTSKAAKARATAAVAKAKEKKKEPPSSSASTASSDYHDTASAGQSTASTDTNKKRKTSDAVDKCSTNETTLRNDELAGGAAWSTGQTMQQ